MSTDRGGEGKGGEVRHKQRSATIKEGGGEGEWTSLFAVVVLLALTSTHETIGKMDGSVKGRIEVFLLRLSISSKVPLLEANGIV